MLNYFILNKKLLVYTYKSSVQMQFNRKFNTVIMMQICLLLLIYEYIFFITKSIPNRNSFNNINEYKMLY